MHRSVAIAALVGTLAGSPPAIAEGPADPEDSYTFAELPAACLPLLELEGSPARAWGALLSVGACVQDASVIEVADRDALAPMVAELARRLQPAMAIYLHVIDEGPAPLQLRAVYQVGLAHVALMVRARRAIAAPPATDRRAAARARVLRDALEPLLQPAAKVAWVAFAAIDQAVAEDPSLAPDAVTQHVVRDARVQLQVLTHAWVDDTPRLAGE